MKYYRKRTPIVDDYGKLWIPTIVSQYCVQGPSFIVKDPTNQYPYRSYKPDDFTSIFEEVN